MSMAEPFLPHPQTTDRTTAAEPGAVGPEPEAPEEPDVLPENLDAESEDYLDGQTSAS